MFVYTSPDTGRDAPPSVSSLSVMVSPACPPGASTALEGSSRTVMVRSPGGGADASRSKEASMGARGSKRGEVGTFPATETRERSDRAARWSEMRQPIKQGLLRLVPTHAYIHAYIHVGM